MVTSTKSLGFPPKLDRQGYLQQCCRLLLQARLRHLLECFLSSLLLSTVNRRHTCVHSWEYGLSHDTQPLSRWQLASEVLVHRKSLIKAGGMDSLKQLFTVWLQTNFLSFCFKSLPLTLLKYLKHTSSLFLLASLAALPFYWNNCPPPLNPTSFYSFSSKLG